MNRKKVAWVMARNVCTLIDVERCSHGHKVTSTDLKVGMDA